MISFCGGGGATVVALRCPETRQLLGKYSIPMTRIASWFTPVQCFDSACDVNNNRGCSTPANMDRSLIYVHQPTDCCGGQSLPHRLAEARGLGELVAWWLQWFDRIASIDMLRWPWSRLKGQVTIGSRISPGFLTADQDVVTPVLTTATNNPREIGC